MDLCRHLRWKTFSREEADPSAVFESLSRDMVPYSCLKTLQPWGPDDDVVAPDCCCSGRACFQRDPLSDEIA